MHFQDHRRQNRYTLCLMTAKWVMGMDSFNLHFARVWVEKEYSKIKIITSDIFRLCTSTPFGAPPVASP
jgi:hypothetical protein